jgi:hypothetical protein
MRYMKHAPHPDPAPSGAKKIVDIPICPFKSVEQNQLHYATLAAGFTEEVLIRLLWLVNPQLMPCMSTWAHILLNSYILRTL